MGDGQVNKGPERNITTTSLSEPRETAAGELEERKDDAGETDK